MSQGYGLTESGGVAFVQTGGVRMLLGAAAVQQHDRAAGLARGGPDDVGERVRQPMPLTPGRAGSRSG